MASLDMLTHKTGMWHLEQSHCLAYQINFFGM